MSLIPEHINDLRHYVYIFKNQIVRGKGIEISADGLKEFSRILSDSVEIIEELSAKLQAHNFRNGWIKCEDRLPREEDCQYLCCFDDGFIATVSFEDGDWELWADSGEVIAWQGLPQPLKESD